jgi:hypothetical protein
MEKQKAKYTYGILKSNSETLLSSNRQEKEGCEILLNFVNHV